MLLKIAAVALYKEQNLRVENKLISIVLSNVKSSLVLMKLTIGCQTV